MSQPFAAGDFLVFQLESAFALIRIIGIEGEGDGRIWHLKSYDDLFPDVDSAEAATENSDLLTVDRPHMALTTRAFLSTQSARLRNQNVAADESDMIERWRRDPDRRTYDRSVRLLLGLR